MFVARGRAPALRSPKRRNAVISPTVSFPVLDGYGDSGLSVMSLECKGLVVVPDFANFKWDADFTITAYVLS